MGGVARSEEALGATKKLRASAAGARGKA